MHCASSLATPIHSLHASSAITQPSPIRPTCPLKGTADSPLASLAPQQCQAAHDSRPPPSQSPHSLGSCLARVQMQLRRQLHSQPPAPAAPVAAAPPSGAAATDPGSGSGRVVETELRLEAERSYLAVGVWNCNPPITAHPTGSPEPYPPPLKTLNSWWLSSPTEAVGLALLIYPYLSSHTHRFL